MDSNVLAIKKAADEIGITDVDSLRKSARKYGALIVVGGGLEFVDMNRFNSGVETDVKTKAEQVARRAQSTASGGRQLGLLKARTERYPTFIVAKQAQIEAAREKLGEASTAYDKSRAKKLIGDLEAGLKRLKENQAKDKNELEKILNEPDA